MRTILCEAVSWSAVFGAAVGNVYVGQ
jgi:hypothetical protein